MGEFIGRLVEHGVSAVVDVRELPLSRKAGFSKRGLAAALDERGIEYIHMKQLGTPRPLRLQLRDDGDYEAFFALYEERLQQHGDAIEQVTNVARARTVCLMCFEGDHRRCHRSVLARRLTASGFAVVHL